jgi:uncharacterized protein
MSIIAETIRKTEQKVFSEVFPLQDNLPRITSFLVKVTARCNLNCDYCYVFNHADQSWRKMPSVLSPENRKTLAERLGEYAREAQLDQCLIIFHGGEPLLVGVERLVEIARMIKSEIPAHTKLYFSLQTNGTLLTREKLDVLAKEDIGVSLSLDGPQEANDLHRLNRKGNSSFEKVLQAFHLLKEYPKTFTGVIGVIDPRVSPREILSFFAELNPPQLDLLLPDANYLNPPPLRDQNPNIYVDWLIELFNIWYDEYPELQMRYFEGLLAAITGLPSQTDAFGLGDVSLLSIETDGFYHDLDVLKITEEGKSSLEMHLKDASILEAIASPKIAAHRQLLSLEGLSESCKVCPEVKVCGGGAIPHRYDKNGFNNPTIYCREMLSLISHVRRRLIESVALNNNTHLKIAPRPGFEELKVLNYEKASPENLELKKVYDQWSHEATEKFIKMLHYVSGLDSDLKDLQQKIEALSADKIKKLAKKPATLLWMKVLEQHQMGLKLYDIEGKIINPDPAYLLYIYENHQWEGFEIHHTDYWLRCPFGNSIIFEEEAIRDEGLALVENSLKIIEELDPDIRQEIEMISPYIQFIRDPSAHPDKVVSFSDNIVPGALYVGIRQKKGFIDPYDLADSIIHEHRHQKLYLLEQFVPVVTSDTPLISSPWRKELRPVSGVYHGAFVFHQLKKYWQLVYQKREGELQKKAKSQMDFSGKSLAEAIETLQTSPITTAGRTILDEFKKQNTDYL